ncbi:glycine zipper 2TM domain-containing protein [Altererythrobacter sp. MF3-039]|uniref:glycine zipper 2TM domain-containing protein n=1 Tax=Altererythrobacter sp. MF3-039 TaxID=3252901 RepID=UPI00390CD351
MTGPSLKSAAFAFAAPVLALAVPITAQAAVPSHAVASAQAEVATHRAEQVLQHHKRKHWKRGKAYGHRHHDRYSDGRNYRRAYYDEPVYRDTRVWRGDDGRYYCRRKDGTTGLLIGAAVGGLIGHEVAGRNGDRTLGAILGAAGGAILGRSIDRSNSRCR